MERGTIVLCTLCLGENMTENNYKGKNVLVTGGSGVIGTHLIKKLVDRGANVRNLDFRKQAKELTEMGIEHFCLDMSNKDFQPLFRFEPDYVFHLAADFERSTETYNFWDSNFKNNVLASHNLMQQVTKYDSLQKIIFASSYLIYDKSLYSNPSAPYKLTENDPIDPRNLCGLAKLQTETDLEFLSTFKDFDVVSARIYRVYGEGSRDIISRWAKQILDGNPITVFSKNNKFDYIYAGDVAEGLLRLGSTKTSKKVYNLGTGVATSVANVVNIFKNKLKDNCQVEQTDDEICAEGSYACMKNFKKDLAWMPETSIEQGIQKIIDYERKKR